MSPRLSLRRRGSTSGRRRGMNPLVIAGIVVLVPVLITYYAFTHRLPFVGSSYTDYAVVVNSVNVRPGSPVRIAGIDVGQVSGVSPDGTATRIAFTLDPSALPVHRDATLTIRDRLFLEGGYYLLLDPGSPSAPVAPEGFTIRQANTATPVQFFQLLSTFNAAARASLQNLLKTTNVAFSPRPGQPQSNSGAGALKQAIPALTPDLKDAALISESLTGTHAGDVQTLLSSTADVTGTLATHRLALAQMVARLDTVAGTLAGEDDAIGRTISGVDATLRTAPTTLVALDRSLTPLDNLAAALTPSLKVSPPIVSALAREIVAVNRVVRPAARGRLIASLSTLLVRFPVVATQLADFFPATAPAARCLATRVTPLLQEQVQDGALSTHDPVWKDLVHMLPNLAGASGNFDGNGPYLRALVGLGSNSVPSSLLGSLPGVGTLLGSIAGTSANNSGLQGTAPQWLGDLTAADFRPNVPCGSQPLPNNLVANPAEAVR
ncbi:MAG TPA: MlaD family protein [Solirubrobacteraceae bacterium]|nr:MlaD family protein [Solirubrobacteraceae bacterium]